MEFGAHLPVLSLAGEPFSIPRLTSYATAASQLGYTVLCANDHLVYSRPHLDLLTALAVFIESCGQMKFDDLDRCWSGRCEMRFVSSNYSAAGS